MEFEQEEELIDIREYAQMVLRKWWILAILMVVSMAAAAGISYFILEPVYESKVTLFVGRQQTKDEGIQMADITLNQQLVKDYQELAKSRTIARAVIERQQLPITVEGFIAKINVSLLKDTRVFQITVSDIDPVQAMEIANVLSEVFIDRATEIMRVENIQVIDPAEIPEYPFKPNPKRNMAIAGAGALVLGLGIIFFLQYMDNTIKTPDDVEKYLGLHTIGAIPLMELEKGDSI